MTKMDDALEAYNSGALDKARALSTDVLRGPSPDPRAHIILGLIHTQAREYQQAAAQFADALKNPPRDLDYLTALGDGCTIVGMFAEARWAYVTALQIEQTPAAMRGLGNALMHLGDWDAAREAYERLHKGAPNAAGPLAALADIALKQNDPAQADKLAQQALAREANHPGALLVSAELAKAKAPDRAMAFAERLLDNPNLNRRQRSQAHGVRGEVLEAQSRFDQAFAAFEQANAETRPLATVVATSQSMTADRIEQLRQYVEQQGSTTWPKPGPGDRPDPVFLVGFPRSGTTLFGQILAAHPQIETLEESENLRDALTTLLLDEPFKPWSDLTPASINQLRDLYWRRVTEGLRRAPAKPVLIDKMPMNVAVLPLVHLLFPKAKIVMAIRDPRDVVMSCFKQRFALNTTTTQFLSLDTTVSLYDAAMRSAETARKKLPLQVHEVRYEQLVRDFDGVVRAALTFVGPGWNDNVRNYADTARAAQIRTPSANAVVRPITTEASGKWKHYEKQLAPYRQTLDPWVRKLGYT